MLREPAPAPLTQVKTDARMRDEPIFTLWNWRAIAVQHGRRRHRV
jgi:hypothetical protein